MNRIVLFLLLAGQTYAQSNKALADELISMRETDQIAAYIPQGKYKALSPAQWEHFKDSVFRTHQVRMAAIFRQYGFPGFQLVGKDGSNAFWLMVQHSDANPAFQQQVLTAMEAAVKRHDADSRDFAYLTDRVRLNTGQKQVYGTQVTYNTKICQALPQPLADSATVDERRKAVGLEPLKEYLNGMSVSHFEMNKEGYEKKGIYKPVLYP